MDSQCLMVNCRNLAPDNEAFCAKHRDRRERKLEDIPPAELLVRLATANEVIAEQLEIRKRLEEERQTHLEAITNLGAVVSHEQADATRYRWLRDHSCPPHNFYISVPDEFHGIRYTPAEVDAYIDAAIGKHPLATECPSSHDGRCHVDTSMGSGPNNCFHCERPM